MTPDPRAARASHLGAARELVAFDLSAEWVDIRGWSAYSADARLVGTIDRIMVEQATKRVRYVCLAVAADALPDDPTAPGSVLIPIGLVRRFDRQHAVQLDHLTSAQVAAAPRLHARPVMRADEDAALAAYGLPTSGEVAGDLYDGAHFDEQRMRLPDRDA